MRNRRPLRQDEVDQAIDSFFSGVGRRWKSLLLLIGIFAVLWLFVLPKLAQIAPYILYGMWILFQLAFAVLFMIVQFAALFWFLGRGRTYWLMPGESGIGFKDVKGQTEIVEVARRVVTLLRGVKGFKEMGGEVTRGLLLIGPPGTGKSYLAQAISTEAGVPFCYASAPSFQNMFMGIGNLRIMMLYGKARAKAKEYGASIVFIDEIDAIGGARTSQGPGFGGALGGLFGGGTGMLNELLLQMDPPNIESGWRNRLLRRLRLRRGRAQVPPVLTIGATNIPEVLDPALLRPGRFDRKIVVDLPDFDGRKEIIQYYLDKVAHEDMLLDRMASDTIGYSPVAIKFVINEAVVGAHFRGRTAITYADFTSAREFHEWGLRQPIRSMSQEERRRIAYHEAGHAFAQLRLFPRERLNKVTIVRHGRALGLSATKPLEEMHTRDKQELLADIKSALASRAAEQLFLGTELSGVTDDLRQATQVATAYIGYFGMNGSFYSLLAFPHATPPDSMREAIEKLLKQQFEEVKALLAENREAVAAIAEALLERFELDGDQVKALVEEVERKKNLLPVAASPGVHRPEEKSVAEVVMEASGAEK